MSDLAERDAGLAADANAVPLCVDLDGTLLRIDTLLESAIALIASDPRIALAAPGWLLAGKPRLKSELARRWDFDPARLPANPQFLAWLQDERRRGRRIVLCTAANERIARRIAAHFELFDEVLASDESLNLRGAAKAAALVERFGEGGFDYAGNDRTDLEVWRVAREAIVVGADAGVSREASGAAPVAAIFDVPARPLQASLRALRPYQWVKNALCFVPMLVAGAWLSPADWLGAALAAVAFCLAASSIYLLNDMTDLAADRAHPRKRRRPFAAGDLPLTWGVALAPVLLVAGLAIAAAVGMLPVLAGYLALSLLYTFGLKEKPLVDVFLLAGLYCARIIGGGEASGHPVSLWLLAFASFLFFSLALVKRVSELLRLKAKGELVPLRRGYTVDDIPLLQMFACAASFASAIVLSLYLQSSAALQTYGRPAALWGAIPLLLFWQCRLWLATTRGQMHDDPILYAARDRVSWAVAAALVLLMLGAAVRL